MMYDIAEYYKNSVQMDHRQKYGQFFTPIDVARFMCEWVLESGCDTIIDPAFGLGAFYFALRNLSSTVKFKALELDDKITAFYRSKNKTQDPCFQLDNSDYLAQLHSDVHGIVCNPPYQRFQHFENRHAILQRLSKQFGFRINGYTNIASVFLLKSIFELKPMGRLAYIMPSEFLNTGYGKIVKEQMIKDGHLKYIIRFDVEREVFPEVTTTIAIVLLAKDNIMCPVKFLSVNSISELTMQRIKDPASGVNISTDKLDPGEKWMSIFDKAQVHIQQNNLVPLSYYGAFSRGIATGANEFFTLSKSDIRKQNIPVKYVKQCITKSAQVKEYIFDEEQLSLLIKADAPVYLLNAYGDLPQNVQAYIEHGRENGYHERYLTKCRKPWYKLESREPAPILFGVFSRNGYKVVRNLTSAVSLTCFHCYYPNIIGSKYVDHLFAYLNSETGRMILRREQRQYGDNLNKFEPNDLNKALVPSPEVFDRINPQLLKRLIGDAKNKDMLREIDNIFQRFLLH